MNDHLLATYHTGNAARATAEDSSGVAAAGLRRGAWQWPALSVCSAVIEPAKARSQDSSNRRVIFLAEAAA
jgi:hypothetical protein